jgi:quercetin dioxygenase-like cupin family protein
LGAEIAQMVNQIEWLLQMGVDMSRENAGGKLEASRAFQLNILVEYAEASTVSRIITKNSAGNVTLFAFDEGQSLSEHSTPFDALVQVIDGEVNLTIGGETVIARTGEVVLMPANVPHAVTAVKRFKMLLTMLRGS